MASQLTISNIVATTQLYKEDNSEPIEKNKLINLDKLANSSENASYN